MLGDLHQRGPHGLQRRESRVAAKIRSTTTVLTKNPIWPLELGAGAVGRAARHGDVVLTGVPREEDLERREQQRACAVTPWRWLNASSACVTKRIEGGVDVVAAERLDRGGADRSEGSCSGFPPASFCRQKARCCRRARATGEPPATDDIGVLHEQRGQRRGPPGVEGLVERRELARRTPIDQPSATMWWTTRTGRARWPTAAGAARGAAARARCRRLVDGLDRRGARSPARAPPVQVAELDHGDASGAGGGSPARGRRRSARTWCAGSRGAARARRSCGTARRRPAAHGAPCTNGML